MTRKNVKVVALLAAFASAIAVTTIHAREKDDKPVQGAKEVPGSLMQQKLEHAQGLLSALSVGDFDRMVTDSRELQRISLEARWSQPYSPEYAEFGDDFRSSLDRVIAAAQKRNIDGAALNYVEVVLTCIDCHKAVREGQDLARHVRRGDSGNDQREVSEVPGK